MSRPIPTTPVDVAALVAGHLFLLDGVTVKALSVDTATRERRITWLALDVVPPGDDDRGQLRLPVDGSVDGVRRADWEAARRRSVPARTVELMLPGGGQ